MPEGSLVPFPFTAETLKLYKDPFVRPVIVAEVAVEIPSLNVDHDSAVLNLYSTT